MFKIFASKSGTEYLYDSVSNLFFQIDEDSKTKLGQTEGDTTLLRRLGTDFWNSIYGSTPVNCLEEYCPEIDDIENPEILVLELTQQCNFRCSYCIYSGHYKYERQHQNVYMSKAMVDEVVEQYFTHNSKTPAYVSLYGGEPLLQLPLIQYLIERIETAGYSPEYAMTTNGFLLSKEEILMFLIQKKIHLNVSFDGLNHDRYRKTANGEISSETILRNLKLLQQLNIEYFENYVSISVTLTPPYRLYENAIYFNKHELLSHVNLSVNNVNTNDTTFTDNFDMASERKKLIQDYQKLADEYINGGNNTLAFHKALFDHSMLRFEGREMALQHCNYAPGPCIPGKHRLFITAKGNKYMCERVGNYGLLGTLNDKRKIVERYHHVLSDYKNQVVPNCKDCLLVRLCDNCYSVFREGNHMGSQERINSICCNQRKWYDFLFYIYLSKKESEITNVL